MMADKSQVIVACGDCASHTIPTKVVHHRDFPEVCGEGSTVAEGAENLVNLLVRAESSVGSGWRRGQVERAIADVRAFLDDLGQAGPSAPTPPAPAAAH